MKMDSGLDYMTVRITDINHRMAEVRDQFDRQLKIRVDIRRGNGPKPRVGETWLLDRTLGPWTFSACLDPRIYAVTGSTDQNPALISLIETLTLMGLIRNNTVNTQLNSRHPHTHPHSHAHKHVHTHPVPGWSTSGAGDPSHAHGIPSTTTSEGTDNPLGTPDETVDEDPPDGVIDGF